jgi:4-amino-4-deoxy-L-arabinose transferase-like glycosyltransferase
VSVSGPATVDVKPQKPVSGDTLGTKARFWPPRWPTAVAAGLLLLHGILSWSGRAFGITTGNDDAAYLLLARSLRQFTYRDFHLLGTPVHSQYPPGFPAFLAAVSLPFGERLDLILAAIALCSVAALALLHDAIRRLCGSGRALTVLGLCAVNPGLLHYAGSIASEALYLLFTVLTLWALVRESGDIGGTGARRSWWPALAIASAVCAALTRAIGLTVIVALFLFWLLERRYRRALILAGAVTLTAGSWLIWTVFAPSKIVGRSYIADATFAVQGQQKLPEMLIQRAVQNVPQYLATHVPSALPQPTVAATVADNLLALVLLLVLGAAGAWVLWKRARFAVIYFAAYAALLTVWPWRLTRFLVPVVPFLFWMLIAGAVSLSLRRRWLRPLPVLVAGAIFLAAISRSVSPLTAGARCDRDAPTTSTGCYSEPQRAFFAAMNFVRQSTPDSAVFLTVKEGTLGYLGARRALAHDAVAAGDPAAMLGALRERGVDFVVLTPLQRSQAQHLSELRQACGELELVKEFAPLTFVLRVKPAGSIAPTENACSALERYERENVRWTSG